MEPLSCWTVRYDARIFHSSNNANGVHFAAAGYLSTRTNTPKWQYEVQTAHAVLQDRALWHIYNHNSLLFGSA